MSCNLWVAGTNFDVDNFIKETGIEVFHISYKGVPRYKEHPDKLIAKHNAFSARASNAGFHEFRQQVADAIKYLNENRDKLKRIKQSDEIEYANLDFGIWRWPDKPVQSFYFPPELLALTGELGLSIEIATYSPDFFESEEDERE